MVLTTYDNGQKECHSVRFYYSNSMDIENETQRGQVYFLNSDSKLQYSFIFWFFYFIIISWVLFLCIYSTITYGALCQAFCQSWKYTLKQDRSGACSQSAHHLSAHSGQVIQQRRQRDRPRCPEDQVVSYPFKNSQHIIQRAAVRNLYSGPNRQ